MLLPRCPLNGGGGLGTLRKFAIGGRVCGEVLSEHLQGRDGSSLGNMRAMISAVCLVEDLGHSA